MIFRILAAVILALFWGVFFARMIAQRRGGLDVGLLKRGTKSAVVFRTELAAKGSVFLATTAQIVSAALDWHTGNYLELRVMGVVVAFAGVTVFAIAVRTMAGSWRTEIPTPDTKTGPRTDPETGPRTGAEASTELVTGGIFRLSRNPAFVGFDLMFAGLATMFFNPMLLVVSLAAIAMLDLQIRQEEKFLAATFGEKYTDYKTKARRYF